jgi:hypothetical protein
MIFKGQETPTIGGKPAPEQESPPRLTLEKRQGIPLEKFGRTTNYDSFAFLREGRVIDEAYWQKFSGPELINEVLSVSDTIEQNPEVKAFTDGHLDIDVATTSGEEVLGFQYLDMLRAIDDAVFAGQLSTEDIGKLLDYVYSGTKPKPFAGEFTRVIFNAVLSTQREDLYKALALRRKKLADASAMIDKLPWGGIFLLDKEPTVAELSQSFAQTEDEAEKNLVVDSSGRIFLVKGMDKNTGTITYRHFPDITRDFHTHRVDYPFSTGDIGTYKSLGASRDIYSVSSEHVDFFVCSPSGIFEFTGDLTHDVFDRQDRKTDSLTIPCGVVNEDTGESSQFLSYTNHERGEAGQFIQEQIKKGASRITITFDNGDIIKYTSWREMDRQKLSTQKIQEIQLKNS